MLGFGPFDFSCISCPHIIRPKPDIPFTFKKLSCYPVTRQYQLLSVLGVGVSANEITCGQLTQDKSRLEQFLFSLFCHVLSLVKLGKKHLILIM